MKTPFTQTELRKLVGKTGQRMQVNDGQTPGLRAELRPGGRVSFYLVKRMPGVAAPLRKRLGGFPELTIQEARTMAVELLAGMAKGIDPVKAERQKRGELTIGRLFDHWIEHGKVHKKTWQEDERLYKCHISHWNSRKLSAIDQSDVKALHAKLGTASGHYLANRVLSLLRAAYNEASRIGYRGGNPAEGIKRFKEESRDRFLQPEELPRFFAAVAGEPNATLRDFFMLALFTGARRSNVCAMRWDQIDLSRGEWRIPDTKAGRPQIVYLPEPAIRILKDRKQNAGDSPFVLASRGKSGYLTEPKVAWKRLLKRAGIENLRIHDLRRTLGSYQAIQGASLSIIGASLGHSQAQTTQVYARLTTNAVADSVGKAVGFIVANSKPVKVKKGKADGKA